MVRIWYHVKFTLFWFFLKYKTIRVVDFFLILHNFISQYVGTLDALWTYKFSIEEFTVSFDICPKFKSYIFRKICIYYLEQVCILNIKLYIFILFQKITKTSIFLHISKIESKMVKNSTFSHSFLKRKMWQQPSLTTKF